MNMLMAAVEEIFFSEEGEGILALGNVTWQGSRSAVQTHHDDCEMSVMSGPVFGFPLSVIENHVSYFIGMV